MNNKNMTLLQKLYSGKNIYGTCIVSTSPAWSKAVLNTGIDYVFIDTEHISINRTELTYLCQIYNALEIPVIVRILSPNPYLACMVRDAGAVGVVAPYVESIDQVLELVGAVKYRPLKGKRLEKVLMGKEILEHKLKIYLENYNYSSMCIINIESLKAVDNLEMLLSVAGLDAVIIGPHDLSVSMGLPEEYDHPDFEKIIYMIINMARKKKLAVGIHFPEDPERQIKWIKKGVNIILHSSDISLFNQKLKEDISKIKNAVSDDPLNQEKSSIII